MKFVDEYLCRNQRELEEQKQIHQMCLESKRISILEIKTSLRDHICASTTLPEKIDLKDALEITAELEDELEEFEVKINNFFFT